MNLNSSFPNPPDKGVRQQITQIAIQIYSGESPEEIPVLTPLDAGVGRVVGTIPDIPNDTVIKFARPDNGDPLTDGTTQNQVEATIDAESTPLDPYTLPVIAQNNATPPLWVLYPRAPPYDENSVHLLYPAWDELAEKGFATEDLFAPENWGEWRDQPYLIDFGFATQRSDCRLHEILANLDIELPD